MKTAGLERTSAAKAGWLVIALTVGWVAFIFLADSSTPPPPEPAKLSVPASSLQKAGLRDYVDWEGLPEIFALWADHAEWKANRTRFAWWHPVTKAYSYYFEAFRTSHGFRFREISEPHDPAYHWDESLGDDCPIRFYVSLGAPPPVSRAKATSTTDAPAGPGPVPPNMKVELPTTKTGAFPAEPVAKP